MHANRICHRDIKPENFLLYKEDDDSHIKLIDFGTGLLWDHQLETIKNENGEDVEIIKIHDRKGTLNYMAPEVIGAKK